MKTVIETLNERDATYGKFEDVAACSVELKEVIISHHKTSTLSCSQVEALSMICSKIARIVCGDPNFKDNWHDIAGYATLVEMELSNEQE